MNKEDVGLILNGVWLLYFIVAEFRFRAIQAALLVAKEGNIDAGIEKNIKLLTDDELDALLEKELGGGSKP